MPLGRTLPVGVAGAVALLLLSSFGLPGRLGDVADNPIASENKQPGTESWQLGSLVADDVDNQIKGYASSTSVNKGATLALHVIANPAQTFNIDFYRLGWYDGLGGRLMQHAGPFDGRPGGCPLDSSTGLVECDWPASFVLVVPTTWTTGAYVAVLTNAAGFQNFVPFVVRDDGRTAALLYQQSTSTYQAYNNWGGKSLYDFNSAGGRAAKVSFDRPFRSDGAGDLFAWEVHMIRWLERSGYDVSYSTDVDTHTSGERLLRYKGFLSVGHDEYWSRTMFEAAVSARDAGVNLGFFGADSLSVQVRFEASPSGEPNRVMVCYKDATQDPISEPSLKTVAWRDPPLNQPPQTLVGVEFASQQSTKYDEPVPFVVTNSDHWVYAGTKLRDGDTVPGLVGYEADHRRDDSPWPESVGSSYVLLARSPYTDTSGNADYQNASIYQARSGAWVFSSGTMGWSFGLDRPGYASADVQQITANVLNRFLGLPRLS